MLHRAATHIVDIDLGRGKVTKRFRSWDRGEPEREWSALTLLAEFAPGLSPEPLHAALSADPPVIEMSYLPGIPLGDLPLPAAASDALALALQRLWQAIPPALLMKSTRPDGRCTYGRCTDKNSSAFIAQVRTMLAVHEPAAHDLSTHEVGGIALRKGAEWLASARFDRLDDAEVVLGQGDPNLANFLWDGTEIRIVDFEDSGLSSRPFELALLVEHVSAWSDGRLDPDVFAELFDLTKIEMAMLREFRRLAALFWLIKLRRRSEANRRDHDHALTRQAERLVALLG